MRKKITTLLSVGAMIAGTTVMSATDASAAYSQCPVNEFCIWDNSGYDVLLAYSSKPQPNVGDGRNDRMTSYWNQTDMWISIYDHEDFSRCMLRVEPGGSDAVVDSKINDRLTSFKPGYCETIGTEFSHL
ncbi:peptidase inhibitor family I36 protein [Streptomyces zaomyceticus]|uniref:peptidase inhibitor family I36 protein n=1 Tax=Streptomyces zaomyceticus TaxID=68286 RepID=UPI003691E1BF